ncbi:MAG TPA: DUF305 domain-containing protein [Amycolatopsis sp.]|uniref:DUF305 domain-containing protein n=1 Tax=Amycolatopsis sp. TaxID=37632 RepID=UPI002B45CDFC|nr:DUF305 domain-containing protein [Amycolatopsis sp.]HKS49809.1 DUF305 domain-containing protein [Amycolatopsis sp.]
MLNRTILGTGTALAVAALVLAGCGGDTDSGRDMSAMTGNAAPSVSHDEADVAFAQGMVPHHRQALDMAELASTRASNAQVKDLASRIEKAQDPEIQKMNGWLSQWNAAMPGMSGMPGMPVSTMPGMMGDADLAKLRQATGAEFDKMFLQMMIGHHQGAVEMARTELAGGTNSDAKALAQSIVETQTAEINEMRQLLTSM